jgi:hypothetical protein
MNSITLDGTPVHLNEQLIQSQKLDVEDVATILGLHARKLALYRAMETAEEFSLEAYGRELRDLEYALQRSWGFPQSAKYHRFWEVPRCTCPTIDNEERYPSGMYVVNGNCPVHGEAGYE